MVDKEWLNQFHSRGFNVIPDVLPGRYCRDIHKELHTWLDVEKERWPELAKTGILPLPFIRRPSLINEIIEEDIVGAADEVLSDQSFLYLFMASFVEQGQYNYASEPHRDINSVTPSEPFFVGLLLALTELSPDNGATVFYPGSHRIRNSNVETFDEFQIDVSPGSAVFFDGRLMHRSGFNTSNASRSCLALGFCKQVVQPRFDFSSIIPSEWFEGFTQYQKHKLGFGRMIPSSLDEYINGAR